jgi:hypothetical protein
MTEITDLNPTDASNTAITGESLDGNVANMGRMDNTLRAILGMVARSIRTNIWRVLDNSDDTKELALDLSGLTTATTRTLTVPDKSGVIALTNDTWAIMPIGVPFPAFDHLPSFSPPPTDGGYRYIKLTASDPYNAGVLTGESVSGSAPLVIATAVIDDADSPLNGETVSLINTENSSLRASTSPGTKQNDQGQSITGSFSIRRANTASTSTAYGSTGAISQAEDSANTGLILGFVSPTVSASTDRITFNNANSSGARVGNETRSKNIGVTYYMRIR